MALFAGSSAFAADAIVEVPVEPVITSFNWTGGYVGAQVGWSWNENTSTDIFGGTIPFDTDGFIGGVYAGYNYQFTNNIVLGVDADFTYSDADGFSLGKDFAGNTVPFTTGAAYVNWEAAIRARLGYAMDRFLPYIAGGVAFADIDHDINQIGIPGGAVRYSDTYTGYTIGAGLEYAFTDNLIVRGEYRFSDYGDQDYNGSFNALPHNVDFQSNEVRFGLSYKF